MPLPQLPIKIHSPRSWQDHRFSLSSRGKRKRLKEKFFDIRRSRKKPLVKRVLWLIKKLFPYFIILFFLGVVMLSLLFAWFAKDLPKPDKLLSREIAQSTKIYDRTGEHLLYEIHGEQKRTIVLLNEIPDYAIKATLALEDQHFYEHKGFSLWGIFRGIIISTFKGKRVQGGSTLTQQFVKNAILTNERSIKRKIKELILSYQLERKYAKQDILQMYFNEIPYGSNAYGIEAAANTYFGKSAKELTLAEAALLAALPQKPSYLSPRGSHLDELYGRQQYCLSQMAKLDYITEAEALAAKQEKLEFKQKIEGITAPHFVFYIKELLSEKYGDKMVEQGGLKIISTLDYDMQKKAEEILTEQVEKNLTNYQAGNAALVTIDVKTGQILAMVGSKDFFDEKIDGQVNVALSPRQPGSSFKPIVYTAAWLRGFAPETVIYDLVTTFPTEQGDYIPHNYDSKEHGLVTLRQALAGSLNVPAVKMIYLTGIDHVLDLADQFGYTTLKGRNRFGLSLVLGGGEVKLLEHANAFAALAREGKFLPTTAVLKLEDGTGRLMEESETLHPQKIVEPDIARITTDILSDNASRAFIFGENNHLTLADRPVAAKTGTTNDYHDAWTIGYTPQLVTGVWVGNSDNAAMKRGADGSVVAAPIWQKFMSTVLANSPVETFTKPSYAIPNKPMLGGDASGVKVKIDKMTGLLATEATPPQLIEEKTFKQAHTILYYVNKDDPLGPVPQNPETDPYFKYWEESVAKWAKEHGIINESPPTESDNLHHLADQPQISFVSPSNNENITANEIQLEVSASAPRGVAKVEYYLDNNLLNTIYEPPYLINYTLTPATINGPHQLIAKAYDDLGNVGQKEITINLQRENYLNITWLMPNTSTTLTAASFPYPLTIYIEEIEKVNKIDWYYRQVGSTDSHWFGYNNDIFENTNRIIWSNPPSLGTYKVYPVITDYQNKIINGPEITISLE